MCGVTLSACLPSLVYTVSPLHITLSQASSSQPASLNAYHPDELASHDHLVLDHTYYLRHQLHAVVSRLCEPIDGLDSAQIASALGQ